MKRFLLALSLLLVSSATFASNSPNPQNPQEIVAFNAAQLETPESLVFDHQGNLYISLALTGEIRKIAPNGTQSTFAILPLGPPLTPCGALVGIMGALTIDEHGTLYVPLASCDPANRGIWRVKQNGQMQILAHLPLTALPNGIALHHNRLYVADSALPRVWTLPVGGGTATAWIEHPLLAQAPGSPFPAGNGLKVFRGEVYVANSSTGKLIAIPFRRHDEAGAPRVHGQMPGGSGCDDFSFDIFGSLYCTTDPFLTVVRMDPDGSTEILLTAADGLDGPTSTAFGVRGLDRFNLYITNAAFPFFSTAHHPSLMRLRLHVLGAPVNR